MLELCNIMLYFIYFQNIERFMATINNVVNKNIGLGLSPKDLLILAGAKIGSEKLTKPYLGNSNFKSGGLKLGVAIGAALLTKNKYIRLIAVGVGLDGAEDLVGAGVDMAEAKTSGKIRIETQGFQPVL